MSESETDKDIRVLLVDDEETFLLPMMKKLAQAGFQVQIARSGTEAVKLLQQGGEKFDVAVIDQVMGPPNGTETMIKIHELNPEIEVIILTGWGDMKPGEGALNLGAYRYMSKPTNIEELALNVRMAAKLARVKLVT